jgi:antitoxin ParD1/3/4
MKEWVEAQSESGKYSNSSDYIRDLIRREQLREEKIARMQAVVDEARASGVSPHTPQEVREQGRQMAREQGLI